MGYQATADDPDLLFRPITHVCLDRLAEPRCGANVIALQRRVDHARAFMGYFLVIDDGVCRMFR